MIHGQIKVLLSRAFDPLIMGPPLSMMNVVSDSFGFFTLSELNLTLPNPNLKYAHICSRSLPPVFGTLLSDPKPDMHQQKFTRTAVVLRTPSPETSF